MQVNCPIWHPCVCSPQTTGPGLEEHGILMAPAKHLRHVSGFLALLLPKSLWPKLVPWSDKNIPPLVGRIARLGGKG